MPNTGWTEQAIAPSSSWTETLASVSTSWTEQAIAPSTAWVETLSGFSLWEDGGDFWETVSQNYED